MGNVISLPTTKKISIPNLFIITLKSSRKGLSSFSIQKENISFISLLVPFSVAVCVKFGRMMDAYPCCDWGWM